MANPLSNLKPALEVLAQNVDILPATGQVVGRHPHFSPAVYERRPRPSDRKRRHAGRRAERVG